MKVLITQSNYIPWKGYFDNIAQCDVFVVYDDMQYTRRDWRNRNLIKTPQGLKWLTIPVEVKGKYFQKINETLIANKSWTTDHWQQLKANYRNAGSFKSISPWLENLYRQAGFSTLSEVNVHFIKAICNFLEIKTLLLDSRDFELKEGKTEKLVGICKQLNATDYYTGPAAKNYIDETLFVQENINVNYFNYFGYKVYPQCFSTFEHSVSICDLVLNVGKESRSYLNFTN